MSAKIRTETDEPPDPAVETDRFSSPRQFSNPAMDNAAGEVAVDIPGVSAPVRYRNDKLTLVILGTGFVSWGLLTKIDAD